MFQNQDTYNSVRVTLERPENNPVEPNSTCGEYEANYNAGDIRSVYLPPSKTNS